jgi:hypothetical protein
MTVYPNNTWPIMSASTLTEFRNPARATVHAARSWPCTLAGVGSGAAMVMVALALLEIVCG